jgi:hypothetical protein
LVKDRNNLVCTPRGLTGKGANLAVFASANMARVAGEQKRQGCLFRALFLGLLSFGAAKESDKIY